MDAPPPITPTRAAGRTLLVGPGGDVILVDLAGAEPAEAGHRVTELVASGLAVAVHGISAAAAVAAGDAGALVLVESEGARPALARAEALAEAGVDRGQLLVEVPFGAGPPPLAAIHRVAEAGFAVGVVLQPPDQGALRPEAVDGWQIGALTQVLELEVAAVRGVSPERFRRVAAVVGAVRAATTDRPEAHR